MTTTIISWFNGLVAIVIGHVVGTLIFVAGPIGIARLQGHTAADALWMLDMLPHFFVIILGIGIVPALLLAMLFVRDVPPLWLAIVMGIIVALWVMAGSMLWLALSTNIWEPIFLETLFGAALNQILLTIVSGALAGIAAWCYLMLVARRPTPGLTVPAQGPTRHASGRTIH